MEHIATKHQPTPFGADNRQFQGFSRTFAEVGEYFILSPSIPGMAAVILPIVLRRSALWYIQIKFSSSTVKCIIPHTSNSFFLVLAAAFFGLVACLLSASCLRIDGRGLRILTSRRSSLLIMAYTPCRSFMLVKHRDLWRLLSAGSGSE